MDYFQDASTQRFTFVSRASGVSETTFAVMRFKGLEAISTPYEFEIMLVSGDPDLDMAAILRSQAVFTIHRDAGDDVAYNGILAEFDQLHAYNEHYFYRAKLVPKIWWLMQTQHNQVFLDKTVPEIIEGALVDGGMDSLDYDLAGLEGTYNPLDYVCQYGESHFNFVSRWLEREGVYYYFYHDSEGDKLVLSDSSFSHEPFQQGADLVYSPKTGMEQGHLDEIIINFTCRQKQLPNRIVLKDHNPERPSLEMAVRADVDPDGRGESFLYGEHYNTPEEGERLIAFRVDELLCQKQAFHGDSTVPFLTPGFKFNLNEHYRSAFNQEYMVTSVTHEGDQTNLLKTSVIGSLSEDAGINIYSNSFTAIPADRQYRHPRTAERPRISGTLHGKIDGEQDSPYAQLDEQGRYKVRLPFDINDEHIDGKASARVRMMQPYAGEGKGMQFPLTKGTEVLLTFIDGNPDRPLIAGAVSTETAPSPVNANNQSESVIRSAGNNRIRMEDRAGSERIVMQSPSSSSWIRVGAHNDPAALRGPSPSWVESGSMWVDQMARFEVNDSSHWLSPVTTNRTEIVGFTRVVDDSDPPNEIADPTGSALDVGVYYAEYEFNGDTVKRKIVVYDPGAAVDEDPLEVVDDDEGLRLSTGGVLWSEALGRYGNYINNYPDFGLDLTDENDGKPAEGEPASKEYLLHKFLNENSTYKPSGVRRYVDNAELRDFATVLRHAQVKVSSLDTVNTQEGNIYDFGGYWNYNLGNSYEEAHIDQSAVLNGRGEPSKSSAKADSQAIFGDLPATGGPGWSELNWPDAKGNTTVIPGDWHSDTVWTTKEFGDSYEYRQGSAITVNVGSTLDINYTGHESVELTLRDKGDPASYTHSSGGVTTEKKWSGNGNKVYDSVTTVTDGQVSQVENKYDRNTGALHYYGASSSTGMGTASFEFDYSNASTAKISSGSSVKFTMDMSAAVSMAVNLSADIAVTQHGFKASIDLTTLSFDWKLVTGKAELSLGGIELKSWSCPVRIKKAPITEIEQKVIDLKNSQIKLAQFTMGLSQASALEIFG